MKSIREIITDLNVARSNDCSKEKSEEIKKIINDLLPHEKQEKALDIIRNKVLDSEEYLKIIATNCGLTQEEYDLLKEVLLCH